MLEALARRKGWQSTAPVVLYLVEADEPCFQNLTEKRPSVLKTLFSSSQKLLWVSIGSEAENPYLSMSRGFLNSVRYEQPQCLFQHLNVVKPEKSSEALIARTWWIWTIRLSGLTIALAPGLL